MSAKNIESVYPLSPMQRGMLFHSLYAPETGVYCTQLSCGLEGELNLPAFEDAWQQVVDTHSILRTAFAWEGLENPVQVVGKHVNLPMEREDWRERTEEEQQQQFNVLVEADQRRGFRLSKAPLMRLTLLRLGDRKYRLIWNHHHLLLDGWCLPLLLKDVFSLYEGLQRGAEVKLLPSRPYRDYIAWLQQQDMNQAESYWRAKLKGFRAPTQLGIERTGGDRGPEEYREQQVELSETATTAVQQLAREQGLTVNTIVQGAWGLLLSRYSGDEDVVFGAVVSGRPAELRGVERMLGLFINTLPVRVKARGESKVVEWLRELQEEQVELRQYEYSPLVEVQGWSEIERGRPLFESILVFENYPVDETLGAEIGDVAIKDFSTIQRTNYPLALICGIEKRLWLRLTFDCRRFDSERITKISGHLCSILESMAAAPEQRLSELAMLTEPERHQLLVEWNDTSVEYPDEQTIHELFEQQVERTPEAVAVVFDAEQLNYRELNERANQLAHYLRGLGVGPESRVGICVERSIEMVVGLLGILKAGGAYVPLDAQYPEERLRFMVGDAELGVLLTQQHLVGRLPEHVGQVVCLDADWDEIAQQSNQNPLNGTTADNLAYIIYTSGSTGVPKGVCIAHRAVNRLVFNSNYVQLLPTDKVAQASNSSFDAATFELWGALLNGSELHGITKDVALSPREFAAQMNEKGITTLFLTTALFNQLARESPRAFASLRYLLFGGEAVDPQWVKEVLEKGAPERLLHVYGPTESTTFATWYEVEEVGEGARTIPIGRPLSNTETYVLDKNWNPSPVGVLGELYLGGAGLARGYWQRPELTAERFIPDPFSADGGDRLYRTGDLVRYLEDGEIEYLGRLDHQVKVRGHRIELGEIEAVLSQHEGVRQSVVIAREDTPGHKQLVAYVVSEVDQGVSNGELRSHLKEKLPEYMIPSFFVAMEEIPLTPNGKVDRRALPAPLDAGIESEQGYVAAATPVEELLVAIWREVLHLREVGVHDNFFHLGGHSLLATQVISRLRETFKVELPLRALFETPTIAGLAGQVEIALRAGAGLEAPPITSVMRSTDGLPLSFAQQRLWFIDQLEPGTASYNIPVAVRLSGELDVEALERSFREIVRRHEALRTRFETVDGAAVQVIEECGEVELRVVDLRGYTEAEAEIAARLEAEAEAQRPFDLQSGPLLRTLLLQVAEEEQVVVVTMHHIVSDGWSMGVFIRELASLYSSYRRGEESELEELAVQYGDFAVWQREWLRGEVLEEQMGYWRERLGGRLGVLELPSDRPRPAVQSYRGSTYSFSLSEDVSKGVRELSQREGVTQFMTLLTGFKSLLSRYTGQEEIVVGTPIANRNRGEVEGLIGFFVNTLVLRTDLSGNPTVEEMLGRVRETALGAYTHQDVPFEQLVEELQPQRDLSHTPLFQVMFVLQNTPMEGLQLPGLSLEVMAVESGVAKFDLTLVMSEGNEGLGATIEYNTDLFDQSTIERMARHFEAVVESMVAGPEQRLSELAILTPTERQQLLVEWNDTSVEYPDEQTIHELFEQQVERTPEAVAVVYESEQLTYRELNERANQLAHYLRGLGVGPESRVGICVERSIEMVVGLLGILKAGGAYVPLDAQYPEERLGFMVGDAELGVLLTQQHLVGRLPEHGAQVICLDTDWDEVSLQSTANLEISVDVENPAYMIYTSGSTGRPKGVLISHSAVTRLFSATESWYHFDETDVWTMFHSYAFDFSVWEVWGALMHGGRLVVVPYWVSRSPDAFYELLLREKVTVLNQTPSAFQQLIRAEESAGSADTNEALALRLVIFGGEALEPGSLKGWFRRHGDERPRLVNMYGITETTVHVTYREMRTGDAEEGGVSPIGRRINDLRAYVLDKWGGAVPVGVAGELHIGGGGLARGYWRRPELTAERFIPDPFSGEEGARLYRTGDLVRYLEGGEIEYLGRIDHQVKIRGHRIELGEIEAVLAQHESVRQCVVIAREETPGSKQLVAYVVSKSRQLEQEVQGELGERGEQGVSNTELRAHLKDRLPDYMVPSFFVAMDEIPLTSNGKVDRRALPAPGDTRIESEQVYVAAGTPEEKALAEIWGEVLGLPRVGIHDNFFHLGGDSIRSIQVRARARKVGLEFSIVQLFEHQTIEELAKVVTVAEPANYSVVRTAPFSLITEEDRLLLPPEIEDAYPLARLQSGMLFHSQYSTDTAVYHDLFSFHLEAPLETDALQQAIDGLMGRHPVLRTSFDLNRYSEPLQLVHERVEATLQVIDLRDLDPEEQEAQLAQWMENEKRNPIDLTRVPLLRFQVYRRSERTLQFTLSLHHAILDGWSVASMLTELFQSYLSILEGTGNGDEKGPASTYRDYVWLERESLKSEETQRYWKENLADASFVKLPRGNAVSRAGSEEHSVVPEAGILIIPLSASHFDKLKEVARRAGAPIKSVLLAAHLRVMSLLMGQADVTTGLVSNGRTEETDGERVLGLFLNTVPFRLKLRGGTWLDLVRKTFEAEKEQMPHRRYPMAQLQKMQGGMPLFETALNYTNFHVFDQLRGIEDLKPIGGTGFAQTNFTLMPNFNLGGSSSSKVNFYLDYNAAEIGGEQIKRIGEYYLNTLVEMAERPEERYEQQSLISDEERERIVVEWNDTSVEYTHEETIHELFEQQVERTPEALAVVFDNEQLNYRELNERANQLAHYLRGLGVGPESRVGICIERSVEMVVGLLGILKAGGAYVPLDAQYPEERLGYMVGDAEVGVLLTQEGLLERLPEHSGQVISLDTGWEEISRESGANPGNKAEMENAAYVIYTSGSTGRPKGVMNTHHGLYNRLKWMQEKYRLRATDRVLQKTTFSFDVSVWEFFWPLINGARLIVAEPGGHQDSAYLVRLIKEQEVTTVHFVPSMLRVFLEERGVERCHSLKRVICSGEALGIELQEEFQSRLGAELHNLYGPTEAAIDVTYWECERGSKRQTVPIGRPIANTQTYILDERGEVVPVGVPGELYLGGYGLARGYWQRPELTAERFIPDPFSADGGERLYRTGDLARYLEDGEIEYLGRLDHQVKVRGHRIELGEIEAVLSQHEGVRQSVVIAREDTPGHKQLVAYVVSEAESGVSSTEMRAQLKEYLPDYMIPSFFVAMDEIPLTPNGKVDRRALPAPGEEHAEHNQNQVAAATPVEELLVAIWREVLHLNDFGIHDDFFQLGGDSILSIQVISRLRDTFKVELPLRVLFESRTISSLAQHVESALRAGAGPGAPPITSVMRSTDGLPLSFAQQRLWFIDQLEPGTASYNIPVAVRLSGELDVEALERSFREIVRRHEALRTRFETVDGAAVQVIEEGGEVELRVVDLRGYAEGEAERQALRMAETEAQRPFDLQSGPLLRTLLLQVAEEEQVVVVTMHHIVSDGWSMGVFIRELASLYSAYRRGEESELEELAVQYGDFAVWQREWLRGEVLEEQMGYWRERLGGRLGVLELPSDRPRPAVQSYRGSTYSFRLSEEASKGVRELSQREGVTQFMTLLTGFKSLLSRYTGQEEIVVGTPIANRNRGEVEGLIGFFVNTLVLRTDLSGNPTVEEMLGRVRETALGAYTHQDVPFEQLVEELQPQRDLSHTPLFQVMFVLQNTPMEGLQLPGLSLEVMAVESGVAKFDLTLVMSEGNEGLGATIEYNTDLFDQSTIERMARHFEAVVESMVAGPEQRLSELAILTPAERQQILVEWNDTSVEYPDEETIHELFEQQVERTPEAVAVVYESEQLNYRELNERANQLAHYLRGLGVGPESRVGICVERSIEMVVGLLGILKAGGAYVPLDAQYPEERLGFMVGDAELGVLLTQQHLVGRLPEHGAQVICLDTDWDEVSLQSTANLEISVDVENPAYMIYTSGSTGRPKGVLISHSAVTRLFSATECWYHFDQTDVWTMFHSYAFDFSVWEVWGALMHGGRLVVVPYWVSRSPDAFHELLVREKVTVLNQTPSAFQQLIRAEETAGSVGTEEIVGRENSLHLRLVIFGGEALEPGSLKGWFRRHGDERPRLVNMYGITETTVHVTYREMRTGDAEEGVVSPIGRRIDDLRAYVLDKWGGAVPVGVAGELHIGGGGLARGYWRRPELTAERFIPDPFSGEEGARLYRTGDLVRYLEDGEIEYLGRIDHQVKIRGHRIELGEIEAVLAQHESVRQCVVMAREETPGSKQLVAYVVSKSRQLEQEVQGELGEQGVSNTELRSHLKDRLPDYMVPSFFVAMDEIPLTSNGKVDRRALPAPEHSRIEPETGYVPPRNVLERKLVKIWEEVLNVQHIGITDNFFDLGGHSLLAVRLMSDLEKLFGEKPPLAALFKAPTIEKLARLLREQVNSLSHASLIEIQPNGSKPPLFFVHPASGHVFRYLDMARLLGPDQPFYGLQAQGLEEKQHLTTEVHAMASQYLKSIRAIQPEGPYLLGGWSMGGVVAFEMARQLEAEGHKIGLLALVDTKVPSPGKSIAEENNAAILLQYAHELGLQLNNFVTSWKQLRRLDLEAQLSHVFQQVSAAGILPSDIDLRRLQRLFDVFKTNVQANQRYVPQPGQFRITLFSAMDRMPSTSRTHRVIHSVSGFKTFRRVEKLVQSRRDQTKGWGDVATRGVAVHHIPGNHYTLMTMPHIETFAEKLRGCLEETASTTNGTRG